MNQSLMKTNQERLLQKRILETITAIIEFDTKKIRNIFNCMQPNEAVMVLELLTKKQKKDVIRMLGAYMDPKIIFLLDPKTKQMAINILRKIQDKVSSDALTRDESIQRTAYDIIKYFSNISDPNGSSLLDIVEGLSPADLASVLELLTPSQRLACINTLYTLFNPITLIYFDQAIKEDILLDMSAPLLEYCLISLSQEDIIKLIEDLSPAHIKSILNVAEKVCNVQKVSAIYDSMRYDEGTIGRIMRSGISMPANQTIQDAVNRFHNISVTQKYMDVIFLYDYIDEHLRLVGQLTAANLLILSNSKKHKTDKMNIHMSKIEYILRTDTSLQEAAFLFKEYSVMYMPVINPNTSRFMGVVSASQAIDIIDSEEQVLSIVGIREYDFYESIMDSVKIRVKWMLTSSIATLASVLVIRIFEDVLSKNVIMAVIMPIVPAIGGSAVSQVFTVTVRAIANQEINSVNLKNNLYKECISGAILGALIGLIMSIMIFILTRKVNVALTIFFPMILNTIWAGFIGTVAPVALNHFGFDAAAASTFLNASTDIVGYIAIFLCGQHLLSL